MSEGVGTAIDTKTDVWVILDDATNQPVMRFFKQPNSGIHNFTRVRYRDQSGDGLAEEVFALAPSAFGTETADRSRPSARSGFIGSLRVAHQPAQHHPAGFQTEGSTVRGRSPAAPGYVTDVAKLFPVEAATLFPLGLAIVEDSAIGVAIIVAITSLCVIVLRYFATQVNGKASVAEIAAALLSFLLWVGATKGYWVEGSGLIDVGVKADLGAKLYAVATLIWVALAPYVIKSRAAAG